MRPFSVLAAPVCSTAALLLIGGPWLPVSADAPATPPTAGQTAPAAMGRLAKGTPVRVRLETSLRSGACKAGDPVSFVIAEDVFGPGGVRLLAKGAAGVGHVTDSAGHHTFKRAGRLAFTCDAVFGGSGGLRVPMRLSVRPKAPAAPPPPVPSPEPPPLNDLHAPSPVAGDVLADTPLAIHGQTTRTITGTFSADNGPDVTADAGEEFTATVDADTAVPVLPAPPDAVVVPPGAVKIDTQSLDTALPGTDQNTALLRAVVEARLKAGYTAVKMPNKTVVMTPPAGSTDAPITLPIN